VVESQPSKLLVAGSIPVSRSRVLNQKAQLVEHSLGKLSRLAGVSEAGACWRNPERSEGAEVKPM
jgi:hypothetical protein